MWSLMRLRIRQLVVLALLLGGCAPRTRVLSVHLADYGDSPPAGRFRVDMPRGESPLYAEPPTVLDERDFRSATFGHDASGLPELRLCFAPGGREKFNSLATHNLRRRLVFLVRGKLLFAPVIDAATAPECLQIAGAVTPEDAAALQRVIR